MVRSKKTPVTPKKPVVINVCDDCQFQKWFFGSPGDPWNTNPEGKAITMHCIEDPNNEVKGIFPGTRACSKFRKKQTV